MRHTKRKQQSSSIMWTASLAIVAGLLFALIQASKVACTGAEMVASGVVTLCEYTENPSTHACTAAERHMMAQPASNIHVLGLGQASTSGNSITRLVRRTGGGSTPWIKGGHRAGRGISFLAESSFALALSGVTFVTSRACDYYVFALRRILD